MRFSYQALLQAAVALFMTATAAAANLPWQPNLEAAQRVAQQSGRLILIHFWSPGCVPCMRVEREVFARPETLAALEPHFVMVKINAEEAPATTRAYGVSSVPTDVVITPAGQLVSQCNSPLTAPQYVSKMTQIATGHRQVAERNSRLSAQPVHAQHVVRQQPGPGGAIASAAPYSVGPMQPPVVAPAYSQPTAQPALPAATPQQTALQPSNPYVAMNPSVGPPQAAPSYASQPAANAALKLPPGSPPLGLDGYCPVQLVERKQWTLGDTRWGAVHRGRTYLFAGPEEQKHFLANPQVYSPAMEGNDPVAATDQGRLVPGSRLHGVFFENRVYLFADEDSLSRFERNPTRYTAEALQAERAGSLRR